MKNKPAYYLSNTFVCITLFSIFLYLGFSCSGSTEVTASIDFHSFLEKEEIVLDTWNIPTFSVSIYFLPGIQIDLYEQGPNSDSSSGMRVSFPRPEIPSEARFITAEFFAQFSVTNLDLSEPVSIIGFSLFMGSHDSNDIYKDGQEIANFPTGPIPEGAEIEVLLEIPLSEDPLYLEMLQEGAFRLGLRVDFPDSDLGDLYVSLKIEKLELNLYTVPFLFIP